MGPTALNRLINPLWDSSGVDPHCIELSDTELADTNSRKRYLWVYGRQSFNDFMGNPHDAKFCWCWAPVSEGSQSFDFANRRGVPPEYTQGN